MDGKIQNINVVVKKTLFGCLAWTFVLSGAPSWAADASTETEAQEIEKKEVVKEEITVTSTLPELATESRLPSEELEVGGDSDLVESLRRVAGVSAVRRGSINLDPVIRGLQETQIVATVDGARTYAAGPARMDSGLSHVGRHSVETVRLVKGPFALTWGPGALSAVDLTTRQGQFGDEWQGEIGGSYGDNGDRSDAYANTWGGGERYRAYLGVGHATGSDFEAGDGSVIPGDYESLDTRWRFGFQLTDRLTLDWSGGYQAQDDIDYPGRILDATYFRTRSHAVALTWAGADRVEQVYGRLYVNRKDHLMNNDEKPTAQNMPGRIPPFGLRVALPTESNTSGGRFRVDLGGGELDWSVGADFTRAEQTASRQIYRRSNDFLIFNDVVWPDAQIDSSGVWVQGIRRVGSASWGGTLRFDAVSADAGAPSDFFRSVTSGELDQDESHVSAAFSGSFEVSEAWTVQAGIGRAVRSASTLERYSDRFPATKFQIAAEVVGNPEIDPESSLELDLAARYQRAGFFFQAETFYRTIDDYITFVPDPTLPKRLPLSPPTVYRYINGDEATFYGVELSLDQRVGSRFSWHGDVQWIRGTDETFDQPVLGLAPLTVRWLGRGALVSDRLWLDVGVTWTDDQDRVAAGRFEQPTEGHTVVDVGLELAIGRWVLELDAVNVTDEVYADHLNAPNPFTRRRVLEMGRTIQAGFRLGF